MGSKRSLPRTASELHLWEHRRNATAVGGGLWQNGFEEDEGKVAVMEKWVYAKHHRSLQQGTVLPRPSSAIVAERYVVEFWGFFDGRDGSGDTKLVLSEHDDAILDQVMVGSDGLSGLSVSCCWRWDCVSNGSAIICVVVVVASGCGGGSSFGGDSLRPTICSKCLGPPLRIPLLKDLNEKKQSFKRNVVSLASELKELRNRLSLQEQSFSREILNRQEAESKAKIMEKEISRLQKSLEERNVQLQESTSAAEMFNKELDDLRSQLSATKATADASAQSAQSAEAQCLALLKELEEKNFSLKEHEVRVNKLGEKLDILQKNLRARDLSQMQLKDEVMRREQEIMQTLAKAGANKDCELRKMLDEVSPENIEKMNRLLTVKDEEIAKLRDEIRIVSAHWKLKTKELESQLEKHRRADQELKKKVLKLEFCLQESRAQTRKLQRMGERRDKALKELRDQLTTKQPKNTEKQNFWETPSFKIVASMSMLILVMFSKR
ncbi:nuclear envelope-associated protein 2-like [Olea europaea var. sylvestris]|uniref:nuclear envelope-associated protein 2-like n=1 Tax=Olea europaea var. sylvestris TaxID=158386 RepID=UPI000C1D36B5|nr:nuclear envelope-associated protein 2-like [Olea europaea var. sylvestris]